MFDFLFTAQHAPALFLLAYASALFVIWKITERCNDMTKRTKKIGFSVSMSSEEHERFKIAAKDEGRTLSQWIVFHLNEKIKNETEYH